MMAQQTRASTSVLLTLTSLNTTLKKTKDAPRRVTTEWNALRALISSFLYNDAKQIAAGATAVIIEKAPTEGGEENSAFVLAANKGTLAEDKLSISWTTDNFTVLAEKDDSTTAIRVDDGDHFRLYQNSKMTITAADGKKIAKVIITCTGGKNLAADSIVTEGVTAAIDGAVATLTVDGSVDAIVIDAVAQTRIASIEVVFA